MAERRRGAGAIEDFDRARFGGPTRMNESQKTVTATPAPIVSANPDRVMLFITNNGPDVITWSSKSFSATGTRHTLAAGLIIVFQVQNDGVWVGSEMWMATPLNDTAINITEIIRAHADR